MNEDVNNLLPSPASSTSSVDGSALKALGQMAVSISLGDTTMEDTVHVFPSIQKDMLISWKTAQSIRTLPKDYPSQVNTMANPSPNHQEEITADDLIKGVPNRF